MKYYDIKYSIPGWDLMMYRGCPESQLEQKIEIIKGYSGKILEIRISEYR